MQMTIGARAGLLSLVVLLILTLTPTPALAHHNSTHASRESWYSNYKSNPYIIIDKGIAPRGEIRAYASVRNWGADQDLALTRGEVAIANDSRIVQARADLLECMGRGGYVIASYDALRTYRQQASHEAVVAINGPDGAGPGAAVPGDHPLCVAHLERMEAYGATEFACHGQYREVVEPIENQHLAELWKTM